MLVQDTVYIWLVHISSDVISSDAQIILLPAGVFDMDGVCVVVTVELLLLLGVIDTEADKVANVDLVGLGLVVFDDDSEIDGVLVEDIDSDLDDDVVGIGVDETVMVFVVVWDDDSIGVPDNDIEGDSLDVLEVEIVGVIDLEGVLVDDSEKLVVLLALWLIVGVPVLDWDIIGLLDIVSELEWDILGVPLLDLVPLWLRLRLSELVGLWLLVLVTLRLSELVALGLLVLVPLWLLELVELGLWLLVDVWLLLVLGLSDLELVGVDDIDIVLLWLLLLELEGVLDIIGVLDKEGVFEGVIVLDCVVNVFEGVGVLLFVLSQS